jgi:hypothetical protein
MFKFIFDLLYACELCILHGNDHGSFFCSNCFHIVSRISRSIQLTTKRGHHILLGTWSKRGIRSSNFYRTDTQRDAIANRRLQQEGFTPFYSLSQIGVSLPRFTLDVVDITILILSWWRFEACVLFPARHGVVSATVRSTRTDRQWHWDRFHNELLISWCCTSWSCSSTSCRFTYRCEHLITFKHLLYILQVYQRCEPAYLEFLKMWACLFRCYAVSCRRITVLWLYFRIQLVVYSKHSSQWIYNLQCYFFIMLYVQARILYVRDFLGNLVLGGLSEL